MRSRFFMSATLGLVAIVFIKAQDADSDETMPALPTATDPAGDAVISECMKDCFEQSLASGKCTSYTDLNCVCVDVDFQTAAANCLKGTCTDDEIDMSLALQAAQCQATTPGSSGGTSTMSGSLMSSTGTSTITAASSISSDHSSTAVLPVASSVGTGGALRRVVEDAVTWSVGALALCAVGGGLFML